LPYEQPPLETPNTVKYRFINPKSETRNPKQIQN
jgi:hypothetical protein